MRRGIIIKMASTSVTSVELVFAAAVPGLRTHLVSMSPPANVSPAEAMNEIVLVDEVLTPDSSRFWPADKWSGSTRRASRSSSSALGQHARG